MNRWQKIYKDRNKNIVNIEKKTYGNLIQHKVDTKVTLEKVWLLPDDYPVYGDYIYIMDSTPIRSDVFGTIWDLKRDLISQGKVFENIYAAKWIFIDESKKVEKEAWENL